MTNPGGTPVERLKDATAIDPADFNARVGEEAGFVHEHVGAGTFDNDQATTGLEYEFYAVDLETDGIRRIPRSLLGSVGFEAELGLHNAELNTAVHPLSGAGIDALGAEVTAKVEAAQRLAANEGIRLVSDGVWTIGPAEGTTVAYLTEATCEEGLTLGINVSNAARYHGFGSFDDHRMIGGTIDVPGASIDADNAGPVSLTTSIQPHYQCRRAADLPTYHGIALRVAGPLLALGVNSPLLPPALYDDPEPDRELLLERGYAEHRIPVYEQMMNPVDGPPKVSFPGDIATPGEAIDRIVDDSVLVPAEIAAAERFDDAFVHFRHKPGSYWRWVRPVFEWATERAANVRIEFRPISGQPTIPDTVAFLAAVCGLLTQLAESAHPAVDLPWSTAKENFYAAARDGLDAELTWITADGDRTTDADRLYADLLSAAAAGLERHGCADAHVTDLLAPLRGRVDRQRTPASWKRDAVAAALDTGASPAEAIERAQRAYIGQQAATLSDGSLLEWPAPRGVESI